MSMIELLAILPYILLGSVLRIVWGMYKMYSSYLSIQLSWRRIVMEFSVDILFGMFGGLFLSQLGIFTLGVSLGSLVSSLLGANVVDLIAKKFGLTGKMNIVLSDQQLKFTEFNMKEINAITYAKSHGRINSGVYQKINSTTHDVARHELDTLVSKGMLKRVGKKKGAYYVSA
jgi:hypothetical protein